MCHNGALRRKDSSSPEDASRRTVQACLFVIKQVLSLGLDIALNNEIEWRDSKVCFIPDPMNCTVFEVGADWDLLTGNDKGYPSGYSSTLSEEER